MARIARGGIADKIEARLNAGTEAAAPATPTPPPGALGVNGISPAGSVTGQLPPPRTIPMSSTVAPARPVPPMGSPLPGRGTAPPTMGVPQPAPTDPGAPPGRGGTAPFPSPSGGGGGGRAGGPFGVAGIRRRQPGLGGAGPSQYSLDAYLRGRGQGPQPNVIPGEPAVGRQGTSSAAAQFARPSWLPPILP